MSAGPVSVRSAWSAAISWWFPVVVALIALAGVVLVPDLRSGHGGESLRIRQSAEFALTALIVIACTAASLWSIARATPLGRRWFASMLGFNALVVSVKFVLSPSAYRTNPGDSLAQYLAVGLVVMLFYLLAPSILFVSARRHDASGPWSWPVRVVLFFVIASFAAIARFVAVPLVGAPASEYLRHVFSGAGLVLPAVLALAAILIIKAFEEGMTVSQPTGFQGIRMTFTTATLLIVAYHALWVIFMAKVF